MHQQIWKRTDVKTQINEKIGLIVNGIRDLWIRGRDVAESFFRARIRKKQRPRAASFYIFPQKR